MNLQMENMNFDRVPSRVANVTVFRLKGPFTLATMFDLQAAFRDPELKGAIIDMAGVEYMDSAGLGVLMQHFMHTQRGGYLFALSAVSPRVHKLFELTHTDKVFPIFATESDAENRLPISSPAV